MTQRELASIDRPLQRAPRPSWSSWKTGCALSAFALASAACSAATAPSDQRGGVAVPPQPAAAGGGTQPLANPTAGATPLRVDASVPASSNPVDDTDASVSECGRQQFEVEQKPADILLVLDRSGSMQDDVNGDDGEPSKWELVVPALQEVISATDAQVAWGLWLFPAGDGAGECNDASYPKDIAVPVQPNNAVRVNAAITSATPEGDGTPTADAIDEALKYLSALQDGRRKYILLATDGEPSCAGKTKGSDKARTAAVSAVERAAGADVHTFVVGIATTKDSASKTLTSLAAAGGEAPASGYYLASSRAELLAAMQRITGSVASCRFPLAAKPPEPDHVGVRIGTQLVSKDLKGVNGWRYVDGQSMEIELVGAACEQLKAAGAASVSVIFGCKNDVLF